MSSETSFAVKVKTQEEVSWWAEEESSESRFALGSGGKKKRTFVSLFAAIVLLPQIPLMTTSQGQNDLHRREREFCRIMSCANLI